MKVEKESYTPKQEQLAMYAKALAHPARVAIMDYLQKIETCYFGDMHEVIPLCKASVSQHLSVLKEAGLIDGEIMPPKVKYKINRENWKAAIELFEGFFNRCSCRTSYDCC